MAYYITSKANTGKVELALSDYDSGTAVLTCIGGDAEYYELIRFDEDGITLLTDIDASSGLPVDKNGKLKFS